MAKRVLVPKTRCDGTMSEAAFWSFIRSALRKKSMFWKPISICKLNARRLYKGLNKRQKYEYQCNKCKKWYPDKEVHVDHIISAGSLNCAQDLPLFVERLFCEQDNLQVLCTTCHNKKTLKEKQSKKKIK
jgi:5-methylcytosine-specific restriction endonuclease McrA